MDYTVHGILHARILEWVAFPFSRGSSQPGIESRSPTLQVDSLPAEPQGSPRILEGVACPFSRGSSQPRNQTWVSCITGRSFTNWAIRGASVSTEADGKCPCCLVAGSALGKCQFVVDTGMGSHFLLQGILPAWESNPSLLQWLVDSLPLNHQGRATWCTKYLFCLLSFSSRI